MNTHLAEYEGTGLVDARGDLSPRSDLLVVPYAWSVGPLRALMLDESPLSQDETHTTIGALCVVFEIIFVRHRSGYRAVASQGRHDIAVAHRKVAQRERR